MHRFVLASLALLAGCSVPELHDDWPTGVATVRHEAAQARKPCVVFYAPTNVYDHNVGPWQEAFLESPETGWLQSDAELVATREWSECEALAAEFPFLSNQLGPIVLVLNAEGELLTGFSAYGGCVRRGCGRPTTDEFVAMLASRIRRELKRGISVPELTRRTLQAPDEPVFRELAVRLEDCGDYGTLKTVCERMLEEQELRQEFADVVQAKLHMANAMLRL